MLLILHRACLVNLFTILYVVVLSGTGEGKLATELSVTLSPRRFFHESTADKNALVFAVLHE